ncbi:MAG: C39 family peptidase [bacterium]|nr:C39 family peptidase [bacterium]
MSHEEDQWPRKMRWAVAALVASMTLATATPLTQNANLRAGVVRSFRQFVYDHQLKPAPYRALAIAFDAQDHALTCEVAVLKMVLAYRGIAVTEDELLERVGYDPTPSTWANGIRTWGDPDEAFVGARDGIMGETGYGVHAGPIGRVAGTYRRAEVIEGGTAATLVTALSGGNPVIIWGVNGRGRDLTWRTLSGRIVHAVDGEHTRVVVGYTGSSDAVEGFHVMDPIYGEQYWELDEFLENWEQLGRQGVIVY